MQQTKEIILQCNASSGKMPCSAAQFVTAGHGALGEALGKHWVSRNGEEAAVRGVASVAGTGSINTGTTITGTTYKSLMARLAALQEGIGPEPVPDGTGSDADELAATYRRRLARTYFGCGLVTSLVVGSVALMPMLVAHPGTRRHSSQLETASADAAAAPGSAIARAPTARMDSFELPIRHNERANAAFPLQITGADAADAISVVLRDVPEATLLSSGERQDEHTWVLRPADLDNLRLSLREGTPDAFDVTIAVASAAGDQTALGVARVRLLDRPAPPQKAAAATDTPLARAADAKPAPQQPFRTQTPAARPADVAAARQKSAQKPSSVEPPKPLVAAVEETVATQQLPAGGVRPTRPEGMSALGALSADGGDVRQLWWRLPTVSPPAWAPFPDLPGRN
jgi:hypothetical protein